MLPYVHQSIGLALSSQSAIFLLIFIKGQGRNSRLSSWKATDPLEEFWLRPPFSLEVFLFDVNCGALSTNQNTSKEKAICKKGAIRSYKITSKEMVGAKTLKMAYKTLRSGIFAQKGAQR